MLTIASIAGVMFVFGHLLDDGTSVRRHLVGTCITLPALALWTLARVQLGDAFTTRAEARVLVTRGLYARLRNPIYLFGEITSIGLFIYLGWWWALLLSLVTIPLQVRRARREARVLEDAFGPAYRAYRERTWL